MAIECLDQPRPAHTCQQRVCHHLWIQIGPREGDTAEGTLPCGIASRVMEQHKAATAHLITIRQNIGSDGR
jgi:hypothetical protein